MKETANMENVPLKRLFDKLENIEKTLAQLQLSRILMEERKVVTGNGEWEGKTYRQTDDGGIIKEVRIPVCDCCGKKCEQFNSCTGCRRKLCSECSITYTNRIFCADCLYELMPLTKQEYKVLLAISYGLNSLDTIETVTRIRKEEVSRCKRNLKERGLVKAKNFLFFCETELLEKAVEALNAYNQIYGRENDVIVFEDELRRVIAEDG